MFSASSQLMIIAPILPEIGEQLSIAESLRGTLITAYAVMLSVFAIIMGPISDKIGRRRILLIGTGAMALALSLHSAAYDYYSFLFVRALAGAAGGVLSGSAASYIGDYFPYEKRGWANGWVMTGIAAGQIFGIPFGTVLAEWYGFYGPFSLFALTMYIAFMLIWITVPQPAVHRIDGKLTLRRAFNNYGHLLRKPFTAVAAFCYGLMYFSMALYVVYLPTWLETTFNITGYDIASLFLVGGTAMVVTGPQIGKLSDRIGRKVIIIIACLGLSAIMALTVIAIQSFWVAYVIFFVAMVLVSARMSPLQALVSELIPAKRRGTMMSLTISLGQVGMGVGGAIAGFVYTDLGFFASTLFAASAVLVMAFMVWRYLPEPQIGSRTPVPAEIVTVPERVN